jgi:LPS-assembly lipoprotein
MWSSDTLWLGRRRWLAGAVALALPAALGGCGFRPLYAGPAGEQVASELAAIDVMAPKTRLGRILENQLIDDLNPAGLAQAKRYRLDVRLERDKRALAVQIDDNITRFDLTLAAFFTLRNLSDPIEESPVLDVEPDDDDRRDSDVITMGGDGRADGDENAQRSGETPDGPRALYRSAVRRVASYNVIREPFATLMAEQDAERRASVEVSREIRTLLTIYFESAAA